MRLIDADVLIEEIESQMVVVMEDESAAAHMTKFVADKMCCLINRIPTAYDVDKVVAELVELYDEGTCPAKDEGEYECNSIKTCGECFKERMTDIVRNGGKE